MNIKNVLVTTGATALMFSMAAIPVFAGNVGMNFNPRFDNRDNHQENNREDEKDQCKKDGWRRFTNPKFKNQGDCVSFKEREEREKRERCHKPELKLIETITVPSNSSTQIESTTTLQNGKKYVFESSGTWTNSLNLADTEYVSVDSWANYLNGYDITPYMLGEGEFDLQVDGAFVDWGAYNSTHTYTYAKTGAGNKVKFMIFDGDSNTSTLHPEWYGDNQGSLTVKIFEKH